MKSLAPLFPAIIGLLLAVVPVGQAKANSHDVSEKQATTIAGNYITSMRGESRDAVKSIRLVYQWNNPIMGRPGAYLFNIEDNGFVIVSGNMAATPVIGYSESDTVNVQNMPPAMQRWVEDYCEMIYAAEEQEIEPDKELLAQWQALLDGTMPIMTASKASQWLMEEKWGQGESYAPTYNAMCPVLNEYGHRAYVGCAATAITQIMHYWQFPKIGRNNVIYREPYYDAATGTIKKKSARAFYFDSAVYQYALMPNKLRSNSTQEQVEATARLCYHAGVACKMNYGLDGSGAQSPDVEHALQYNFKYDSATYRLRASYASNQWMAMVRREIRRSTPLYYDGYSTQGSGRDAGGHAFVCHGVNPNDTNKFRFNWGWDGSSDGWYDLSTVNGLDPMDYNFSRGQGAMFGMRPPQDTLLAINTITAAATLYGAYPNPATHTVTIPYEMHQSAPAELQVYDITGRLVETRSINAGAHTIVLDVAAYPAGIYVYRINGSKANKFVVR